MYLIEWWFWKTATQSESRRKNTEAEKKPAQRPPIEGLYEDEADPPPLDRRVSENPKSRGPIYEFNLRFLEIRAGASEEKRGLITICVLGALLPMATAWLEITLNYIHIDITRPELRSPLSISLTLFMLSLGIGTGYLYAKYGFRLTRLELLTSRNMLVRFNRETQQVHLHRPGSCGGIITLPWRSTVSSATCPSTDIGSVGARLALAWHPAHTGLHHPEIAFIGKQGQGGSELRDEWEFIRRYMEEGPDAVPRPRLSTRFPSPIQAFSAQFEGLGRFFRKSSWLFKVALLLIWPAFVIVGTGHWLSLMLCWRPRWPKIIREAGLPGKPVPALTTLSDYPPDIQKRLLANADRWHLKPGKRPERKPRKSRAPGAG